MKEEVHMFFFFLPFFLVSFLGGPVYFPAGRGGGKGEVVIT